MRKLGYIILFLSVWLWTACGSSPSTVSKTDSLPDIYPDYIGVTIPVDIAPLDFSMADDAYETNDVSVKG